MQGFNMGRYVPPEVEGTVSSGNALHNKHPLGARARHPGGGLTVRFEMPFPVWCDGCPRPTIIAQGVRFNAVKRRVGQHRRTPIFAFAIRHPACGAALEIRTDPANTDYVVTLGGRRREPGLRAKRGDESLLSPADLMRACALQGLAEIGGGGKAGEDEREAAFANLEKTIADRAALARSTSRVEELVDVQARAWEDPYTRNTNLRRTFRAGRKEREAAAASDTALKDRMGLGDEVVLGPETEVDRRLAAIIDFGDLGPNEAAPDVAEAAMAKPLFDGGLGAQEKPDSGDGGKAEKKNTGPRRLKSEALKEKTRDGLIGAIGTSLRASQDPFLQGLRSGPSRGPKTLPGLVRKRKAEMNYAGQPAPPEPEISTDREKVSKQSASLVSYDSD